ncbi:ASCH domain-containing protein [Streptomyces clavuligerus]|uniref:Putative acetyltransferase n=2 Tax=Streptomyces clavuligerus TaxID=1901 RepID=E2Q5T8_STRCL|nr:RNA-binding protein [Streptomyces clavuligerus]AXU16342.1 ASCH domain-containing protein [Streptomyces clavuligerus]EFG05098.1 Putative acetyltransferase [Streptomyces clavuligerus]MBY6306504.1 ASCH domain-containing protein [Streptomyces clavuligerus]QCS09122.1 ASCH domain-containing protein [Streptomyces clavuligerus]
MPRSEFGFPGPLRDRLVAAILDGAKTATTGLLADYTWDDEPLPEAGDHSAVLDSEDRPVAVIEVTEVRVVPLGEVDFAHVADEGEGHATVAQWRTEHERFWNGADLRRLREESGLSADGFTVDDTTSVVLERFRLVADLRPLGSG